MSDNSTATDNSTAAPAVSAMDEFLNTGSFFLGTCIDGIFYGFFAAAFMVWVAVHRYQGKKIYRGIPNIAVIVLFVLCTAYISLDLWDEYYSLTDLFPERQLHLNTAEGVLYSIIDFVGQATLIYRCWILWNHNFLIILLPALFSVVNLAAELTTVALLASPNAANIVTKIVNLGTSAFTISLAVNVMVMTLIVSKIWLISNGIPKAQRHGDDTYTVIIAMLLESGVAVMVAQLLWLVLFRVDNEGGYNVVAGAVTQTYGITAVILMIRVALGASYDSTTRMGTSIVFKPNRTREDSHTQIALEQKSSYSSHVVAV